ncbi:hypothetical protein MHBO_003802, partial [Bonamia ostreae]
SIDSGFEARLKALEKVAAGDNSDFASLQPLTFTATLLDGSETPLKPNGALIDVKESQCGHYAILLQKARRDESRLQIDAIAAGLATIVPASILRFFSAEELEKMVCGNRRIDLRVLRENTRYRPPSIEESDQIKWLWVALEEFGQEDRQRFLRFVWGQSRLPLSREGFKEKFVVCLREEQFDESLPASHTCFFSLDLPKYTSKNVLKEKLLYAIRNCQEIDTDFIPRNVAWEEE